MIRTVLITPNAFKEAASADEAARAIARGLTRGWRSLGAPMPRMIRLPIADGGDGTADVLARSLKARRIQATAADPLGNPIQTHYYLADIDGKSTALIDLSAASGLWRVPPGDRNPLRATTLGTGQLALDALGRGARRIVIALGGSATVDGASGLDRALGFGFLNARGRQLGPGGGPLVRLAKIVPPADIDRLQAVEWIALTDVANPLLGHRGAARIFGPQKGATPRAVVTLETGLARLADCLRDDMGRNVLRLAGGGAAGGAGAGLAGLLGARLVPGADWVLKTLGVDKLLAEADLLITSEGRLDSQSLEGKAPVSAARMARQAGVPAIALAGTVDLTPAQLNKAGLTAALPITPGPCTLSEALAGTSANLERTAFQVARMLLGNQAESGK